jgi:hypothetical protein
LVERVEEIFFEVMETRAIHIYNGEGEAICVPGEGGGDRKVINGVVKKLQMSIIPGSKDTSGSADRGFEDKGPKVRGEEGGGEERGNVSELGFL